VRNKDADFSNTSKTDAIIAEECW